MKDSFMKYIWKLENQIFDFLRKVNKCLICDWYFEVNVKLTDLK